MLYRIYAFDGLELTNFRQRSHADDMGTGNARTSYMRIPGGFYDNYGDERSPQDIRPISQEGELHADTSAELESDLFALRAKLGVRGILTVQFQDGTLYWQMARLVQVNAPARLFDFLSIPIVLVWESADQIWFKVVVTAEEWSWGDGSWTFGDGTAVYGETGTEETLTATGGSTQEFTVTHNGNIPATNVAVRITAGTNSITSWGYINETRKEQMGMGSAIPAGETLYVSGAGRSVWLLGPEKPITGITNTSGNTTTVTSAGHGYSVGNRVDIEGTSWDGVHEITAATTDTFSFVSRIVATEASGTVRKATESYDNWKDNFSRWPTLDPGDNTIKVTVAGNAAQDAIISWEFYEHYA